VTLFFFTCAPKGEGALILPHLKQGGKEERRYSGNS
jgi:hypothetical protein